MTSAIDALKQDDFYLNFKGKLTGDIHDNVASYKEMGVDFTALVSEVMYEWYMKIKLDCLLI
jgi:hypothetical protein